MTKQFRYLILGTISSNFPHSGHRGCARSFPWHLRNGHESSVVGRMRRASCGDRLVIASHRQKSKLRLSVLKEQDEKPEGRFDDASLSRHCGIKNLSELK